MMRAEYPHHVREQLFERSSRTGRIPRRTVPPGEIAAGGQGVLVVWPELQVGGGVQVVEIVAGRPTRPFLPRLCPAVSRTSWPPCSIASRWVPAVVSRAVVLARCA